MTSGKGNRLLALIYPHAGGYMARILPAGIVCFSENLAGLREEIEMALADYRAHADEFSEAMDDFAQSIAQAEWDIAEETSTLFYFEREDDFLH
jgi:VIT1/CCC1 family predicted Fe2+/Mn2+ transporter